MLGTPPTCAPYAHSARTIRTTIPDIPERHPMFLDVHQYTTTTSRVLHDKQQFYVAMSISASARSLRAVRPVPCTTWPTRGRAGCTISSPWASTPTIPPPGRLIMDMDQGRRRGCARSRSRPRTRARSLSLASQHDPARLSPTLPTETRALHSKLSPTIFHPHDFTNSTNKGHTINFKIVIIYLLLFIIISSHAGGCAFRCHPHGDNCRPQGHEPPHQRGSIQQTCERHATISMRYRTASPAGVYKEPVPRDPLLLAPYEWMCLSLPFIRGTREGSKGRPRRGCQ